MDVHLRRATPADADSVARVYVASWNAGFTDAMPPRVLGPEQAARWARDLQTGPARWWVAEAGGSVVGVVGTGPSRDPVDADLGELDTIAVAPAAWRRGVGRRLMGRALDDLRTAGYRDGIVWTLAGYEPARRFYEATGWRASAEARDAGRQMAFRRTLSDHSAVDAG